MFHEENRVYLFLLCFDPNRISSTKLVTYLNLKNNQLSGEIPETICDLYIEFGEEDLWGNNYFDISNNQLCPPYPECIENYVGEQDTSDCP